MFPHTRLQGDGQQQYGVCSRKQVDLLGSSGGGKWEHFLLSRQELTLMYFSLSSFGRITKLVYARRSGGRRGERKRYPEPVQMGGMAE